MSGLRSTAAVLVGLLLATGMVRGATSQLGALRAKAKKTLESTAAKDNVKVDDDDESGSPEMMLADVEEVAPGSEAQFSVSGSNFGVKTKFAIVGRGFTLAKQTAAKNKLEGTVSVAPGTMPGAALLQATNTRGTGTVVIAYVGGSWQIDGTTDNGWRVRLSPAASGKRGVLAFKAEFFEGAAKTPFTTRDATIRLEPQNDSTAAYTMQFKALDAMSGLGDAECDPIMKRANELAGQLMKATNQAEEDRISAEVDKIQDKIDTCVEKQQENASKTADKMKEVSKQLEIDARKFGCSSLELSVAATGATEGTFTCTVGTPRFTGTMKQVGG